MLKGGEESAEARPPVDENAVAAQADIVVTLVDMAHDRVAEFTGYPGWQLDNHYDKASGAWAIDPQRKELVLWQKIIKFYIRFLPMGEWGHIIDLISLVAMEGMKLAGFMAWRKELKPHEPSSGR